MRGSSDRKSGEVGSGYPRTFTLTLLIGLLAVLVLSSIGLGGRQFVLLHYYDQIQQIEGDLLTLESEVDELHTRMDSTKADPFWTEKLAREKMNYSAPGELIFRFRDGG